jgi:uncharacterized protein (DUF305 family)
MRNEFLAAAILALSAPALAQSQSRGEPGQQQQQQPTAAQFEQMFVNDMQHHHREGIAIADAALAAGTSENVKVLARRLKAEQQQDLAALERRRTTQRDGETPTARDPELERRLTQLKAAKGAAADQLFLELAIAHHGFGLVMSESAMNRVSDATLRSMARDTFAKQAREIGELQRLRDGMRSTGG